MSIDNDQSASEITVLANQILTILAERGFEPILRYREDPSRSYETYTGRPAPAEATALWSVLSGRDILGMCLDTSWSAGQQCDARASEAEFSGPGVPYEELDGSAEGSVRMVWWDRGWCPIYSDADYAFAIDTNPGATGHTGQVIFCTLNEDCDREAVWDSLTDFLRDVLALVSSPGLRVDDGWWGRFAHTDGGERSMVISITEVGRARRDGAPIPLRGL